MKVDYIPVWSRLRRHFFAITNGEHHCELKAYYRYSSYESNVIELVKLWITVALCCYGDFDLHPGLNIDNDLLNHLRRRVETATPDILASSLGCHRDPSSQYPDML